MQIKKSCAIGAGAAAGGEAMSEELLVGEWRFLPDSATLVRGEERRRLEHRTAKVLELLCRRAGTPVSNAELVEAVWGGRALSPNSVAVVIAGLRRALDDDSRHPRYIETIPKRGYRLIAEQPLSARSAPRPRRIRRAAFATVAALLIAATAWLAIPRGPAPYLIAVTPFPNVSQRTAYDPLAPAVTELVTTELGRVPGVQVMRGGRIDARLGGKVILWDGHAAVSLVVEDPATGAIIWSGMAGGPTERIPAQVRSEINRLAAEIARRRGS
jgi:DNA-binding winged helix-turn-helix (wHTH) protein